MVRKFYLSHTRYFPGAMISLRDTLAYLPSFYNLQQGVIYGNTLHAYRPYMHVDQHVARSDGPIIDSEKACRS